MPAAEPDDSLSYSETIDFLYSKLPMFTRIGENAIKKDLTNTLKLCRVLGNPQSAFKSLHIGGTNGKGSTSHMLASILQAAGYKTGLYTSPHLKDFRERIRVNGKMISEEDVIRLTGLLFEPINEIEPSFFEVTVAMAFSFFAEQKVDIAVIEVGLGGRLDSTNIIDPVLSVITNIGYDHVNILGNTLAQIAIEKAGIIKDKTPVIIGERHPETELIFINHASARNATIVFAEDTWSIRPDEQQSNNDDTLLVTANRNSTSPDSYTHHFECDLAGSYQLKNVATVLAAVDELRNAGFQISEEHLREGLRSVKASTGLRGRWEKIGESPDVFCDTGHNEHGIREVLKNIAARQYDILHFVVGMVKDKDIGSVLALLPIDAVYYFCAPDLPRAKPAEELRHDAKRFGLKGEAYLSVAEAITAAKRRAAPEDLIFIGGSTFVVAEAL